MILTTQVIEKEGKKEFAVIPYHQFMIMKESLEDYEDLCLLREEKVFAKEEAARSLDDILKDIG